MEPSFPDLSEVLGQETAKRALEIAAAGGHPILLVGPPGAGKTMLAERLPGLLPPLLPDEAAELAEIHARCPAAGGVPEPARPFRRPPPGISPTAGLYHSLVPGISGG
jgi:magnesium chelatase family protein